MKPSPIAEISLNTTKTNPNQHWKFELPEILQVMQKGDRLHLDCQGDQPRKILRAIARYGFANMQAGGIQKIKLSDETWTLGSDLPIGNAALMAAAIAQYLIADKRLSGIKINVLLKQSFLHILCEKVTEISKEMIVLPMLEALRQTHPADYWQGISVYGKIKGEKSPVWKFDVDPSAIRIHSHVSKKAERTQSVKQSAIPSSPSTEQPTDRSVNQSIEPKNIQINTSTSTSSYQVIQNFLQLKWLGSSDVQSLEGKIAPCIASLAIGIAATIAMGTMLSQYRDRASLKPAPIVGRVDGVSKSKISSDPNSHNQRILDYNNPSLNTKLVLIDSYVTSIGEAPDVMIVGSSRALRGIDPHVMEKSLAGLGYKGISVFNMGINGATAQVVNLQIAKILTSQQLPKLIIWADGVRAFNSNREDETFNAIANSSGYSQLEQLLQNSGYPKTKNASPLSEVLSKSLADWLPAYADRFQIRSAIVSDYNRLTTNFSSKDTALTDQSLKIDSKGFASVDVQFDPQTYFKVYPYVSGENDLDYRNFDLNGNQIEAFNALAKFCKRHRIKIIFVNMPMHNAYLDASRLGYEKVFKKRMQELSKRWDLTYIDFSTILRSQPKYFSDPNHLNRWGAIEVAKKLAVNPNIPWAKLR
jgi:Protein of unknown function (DUF1574)